MRLIEQQMCSAVINKNDWHKDNTRVETIKYNDTYVCSNVYLHNNLIAVVGTNQVEVYDGGWQTNTTKSRLNALINGLCDGYNQGIYQHKFEWFIRDDNEGMQRSHAAGNIHQDIPFEHGYTFSRVN